MTLQVIFSVLPDCTDGPKNKVSCFTSKSSSKRARPDSMLDTLTELGIRMASRCIYLFDWTVKVVSLFGVQSCAQVLDRGAAIPTKHKMDHLIQVKIISKDLTFLVQIQANYIVNAMKRRFTMNFPFFVHFISCFVLYYFSMSTANSYKLAFFKQKVVYLQSICEKCLKLLSTNVLTINFSKSKFVQMFKHPKDIEFV